MPCYHRRNMAKGESVSKYSCLLAMNNPLAQMELGLSAFSLALISKFLSHMLSKLWICSRRSRERNNVKIYSFNRFLFPSNLQILLHYDKGLDLFVLLRTQIIESWLQRVNKIGNKENSHEECQIFSTEIGGLMDR